MYCTDVSLGLKFKEISALIYSLAGSAVFIFMFVKYFHSLTADLHIHFPGSRTPHANRHILMSF